MGRIKASGVGLRFGCRLGGFGVSSFLYSQKRDSRGSNCEQHSPWVASKLPHMQKKQPTVLTLKKPTVKV